MEGLLYLDIPVHYARKLRSEHPALPGSVIHPDSEQAGLPLPHLLRMLQILPVQMPVKELHHQLRMWMNNVLRYNHP